MTLTRCPREAEVRKSLELGHWPHSSPEELREHARGCRECGQMALLTQAFHAALGASAPKLPPPGLIWWRAQLRRRQQAIARVRRPLVGAQIFALTIAVATLAATLAYAAARGLDWAAELRAGLGSLRPSPAYELRALWPAADQFLASPVYLLSTLGMLLLMGGVALYMAIEKQ